MRRGQSCNICFSLNALGDLFQIQQLFPCLKYNKCETDYKHIYLLSLQVQPQKWKATLTTDPQVIPTFIYIVNRNVQLLLSWINVATFSHRILCHALDQWYFYGPRRGLRGCSNDHQGTKFLEIVGATSTSSFWTLASRVFFISDPLQHSSSRRRSPAGDSLLRPGCERLQEGNMGHISRAWTAAIGSETCNHVGYLA